MTSILVVEDEAIVADDEKETLTSLGYSIAGTAKSGEAALKKVADTRPDLVLMDIHLSGPMDGIEAAGQIHAMYDIPVIFLTAYADKVLLDRAKLAEPYGYLIKPYDERSLQSAIEMAVYKHQMEHRLRESELTTRLMINASQDLLYLITAEGKIIVANEALADLAGCTPQDLQGTSVYDLVGRSIISPKMACWQLAVRGDKRLDFEEQLNRGWYSVAIFPVYDKKGSVEKFAVNVRNITAKKQGDDLIRNNADYLRSVIEEASQIVIMLNPDGTFSQASPSFLHALGYLPDDKVKRDFFEYVSMSDWQTARQIFSEVQIHPRMAKPLRLKFETKDGTFCVIKGILSNLSDNPFVGKIVMNGWVE